MSVSNLSLVILNLIEMMILYISMKEES